jgi:SAM-dependent methyltransferase
MERAARSYWDRIALRWRIAEPLAPGREDIDWFEGRTARYGARPVRAMLLGVTAGIATMRWPEATSLTAADWSQAMLKNVWPTQGTPEATRAVCADWRELPIASASVNLVVGDGCYTALGGVAGGELLNAEMRRVLEPGGCVLMRCFCRPAAGLRVESLFEELLAGRIRNLDLFRWLLAMALHGASPTGVALRAVWEEWARRVTDGRGLQRRMGWSDDALANMERMASATASYCFSTLDEVLMRAAPGFAVLEHDTPRYAWGELFPRIVLRSR